MLLRPRQKEFVERCVSSLKLKRNTLGVAPTGAGKSVALSAVIKELMPIRACVIAHRDELTEQNQDKFLRINPHITTSIFNSKRKSWEGQVTFAMVQTLARYPNLMTMPFLDLIVIDETHHITANTYQAILNRAKEINPQVKIFGVTATPIRGDKSSLGKVFDNCADQITLGELIESGHLVPPRTFVVDLGNTQEKLQALRVKTTGDYSDQEVADILDTVPLNSEVIRHWKEKAVERKTVVFCSTIEHAKNVTAAFIQANISAVLVTGEDNSEERSKALNSIVKGETQVIVNVMVLTEGWDFPPISCVILLRSSSYKSTMIQMIGRGLRTIDATLYPDITKTDCIVLDFGISSILHGNLEQKVNLKSIEKISKDAPFKKCPECYGEVPAAARECPLCGFEFKQELYQSHDDITLLEINMFQKSNFAWTTITDNIACTSGFNSWGCIVKKDEHWIGITGPSKSTPYINMQTQIIHKGEKLTTISAVNDFLYTYEDSDTAKKNASWRTQSPTENQLTWLPERYRHDYGLTKGEASVLLTYFLDAKHKIKKLGLDV
jgi:DNA repair protein RadD